VKRHQQHARCDADPIGAGGDRRGGGEDRGKITVFDEVVLGQPDIIKPVVFDPRDLIKDFAVQPVGRLAPLCRLRKSYQRPKRIFRLSLLIMAS
jgi:hypothetical protein